MIYIVKLVNKNKDAWLVHTDSLEKKEDVSWKTLSPQCFYNTKEGKNPEWESADIEVLKEIPDDAFLPMEKFKTMLEDVVKTHKFPYINGRFCVDDYFTKRNLIFILFLHLIKEDINVLLTGCNPTATLHNTLRSKNSLTRKSVKEYGWENVDVYVHGPFQRGRGLYDSLLSICDEHGCTIEETKHRFPRDLFGGVYAEKLLDKDFWKHGKDFQPKIEVD